MKKHDIGNKKYTNSNASVTMFTQKDIDLIYTDSCANDNIVNFLLNEAVHGVIKKAKLSSAHGDNGDRNPYLDELYLFEPSFMNALTNNGEFWTEKDVDARYESHMKNYGRVNGKSVLIDKKYIVVVNNKKNCHWSVYIFFRWTEQDDDTFPLVFVFDSLEKPSDLYNKKMISCISRFLELHLLNCTPNEILENVNVRSLKLLNPKRPRYNTVVDLDLDQPSEFVFKMHPKRGVVNILTNRQTDDWSCGYWACMFVNLFMGLNSDCKMNLLIDSMNNTTLFPTVIFPHVTQQYIYDTLEDFRSLMTDLISKKKIK